MEDTKVEVKEKSKESNCSKVKIEDCSLKNLGNVVVSVDKKANLFFWDLLKSADCGITKGALIPAIKCIWDSLKKADEAVKTFMLTQLITLGVWTFLKNTNLAYGAWYGARNSDIKDNLTRFPSYVFENGIKRMNRTAAVFTCNPEDTCFIKIAKIPAIIILWILVGILNGLIFIFIGVIFFGELIFWLLFNIIIPLTFGLINAFFGLVIGFIFLGFLIVMIAINPTLLITIGIIFIFFGFPLIIVSIFFGLILAIINIVLAVVIVVAFIIQMGYVFCTCCCQENGA